MLRLSAAGVPLSQRHKSFVKSAGLGASLAAIEDETSGKAKSHAPEAISECHLYLLSVPVAKEGKNKGMPFEGQAYFDRIPQEWKDEWKDKPIDKSHWRLDSQSELDAEFKSFINSHIPSFYKLKAYKKFWLYCEQARRWLKEARSISDIPYNERYDWKKSELEKMRQNKLYALNQYITIKEDGKASGRRKYEASAPQALLAFIIDIGLSFVLVKGRQAAITSTMMAIAAIEAIVRNSYSGIFITHKKDGTGTKLFNDKFKSTLQHMPPWIRVAWNEDGWSATRVFIEFSKESGKGNKGRDASEFVLLGSEDSMVANGMTPTQTFFDECQNIPTYQLIKNEIDPTIFQFNENTGEMERNRAIYAWGTGSSNNTGKGAFEADFKTILETWQTGENTHGWVPLFMDWTCRPGMNSEHYKLTRSKYLKGTSEESKGLSPTERLSLFKAHYPSEPDDAFMTSHKTLVPMEFIVECQRFIKENVHDKGLRPMNGRFVPVYDENQPMPPGSDFPYVINNVMWEEDPADSIDSPVKMMFPPERGWIDRYFQGTDPIQNDGGHSRFSSLIWDAVGYAEESHGHTIFHPTVACVLNHRSNNPRELFVQCALMGMYYANHGQKACKEIIEINQGHRYVEVKTGPLFNLSSSLVYRGALPASYRGGQHLYGVDLKGGKGSRKEALYHDITKLLNTYGKSIFYNEIWGQVRHISVEDRGDQGVVWGTENKNVYNDDLVYALGYAELCSRVGNVQPRRVSDDQREYRMIRVLARRPNGMPYYETKKVPMRYA